MNERGPTGRNYSDGLPLDVVETERLRIRRLDAGDAPFILELLNDPSWLQYIGDKGVRTLQAAERYIVDGPMAMYERLGFGLYLVELKGPGEPIGICGVIKRETLDDVDLGFSFLSRFRRNGYAFEAASAVMAYGRRVLGLCRIVAVTSLHNHPSGKLLEKLGFRCDGTVKLQAAGEDLKLYIADLA